jgi:hypothetical protein
MKSALLFCCFGFSILAACSSGPTQSNGNVANCSFPATTASTPTTGDCNSNRTLIECKSDSSEYEICLSDNVNACPGESPNGTCQPQCQPTEYAAACGGSSDAGALNANPPTSSCRALPPNPGGVVFYCCPCGS